MSYNERLRTPNAHSTTAVSELNVSIKGFNEDMQKWETRFIEIKEYVNSLATHSRPIDPGVYAHLFEPLPTLKIGPLEEIQNEEDEDPYRDQIMDKRTGKQYWISTDDGLMNYLTENMCNTVTMPLLPEPQSWEEVEATLILAAKIEKEGESQVLKRYFELGHWLQYTKKFYKENELRARYGKPFWGWARDRTSLSKSNMSKLRRFYEDFQNYEQFTKCAVGLKFILKHQERIIEILNNDERYRQLFHTNIA